MIAKNMASYINEVRLSAVFPFRISMHEIHDYGVTCKKCTWVLLWHLIKSFNPTDLYGMF